MERFPIKHIVASALTVALLFLTRPVAADDSTAPVVTSTDDGHGLYSYTFSSTSTIQYFALGEIVMQSHGILGTTQPPGWTVFIDTNDYIYWSYLTNQEEPLTNALTFTVQSSYPVPRLYNDVNYPSQLAGGFLVVNIFGDPDYEMELGGGYIRFDYFGPSTNGAPTLYLQTVDTNVIVGWHAAAVGHVLQMSTNLAQTNWTPLTNVTLIGHSNFVTVPLAPGPQFFRTVSTNNP